MLIQELHLKGFIRMRLLDTPEFIIRPNTREQIILGTNGSGKSSLFGELTPLPPNPSDYTKDGFKKITITQDGSTYVITTTFKAGGKTSFLKDGEELNPGGTGTIAKELVKEHFGITPAIHDLMVGNVRFTDMSTAVRREWFTRLATVSYDYAITTYNKLKVNYRDVSGALKLDKKRLVVEIEKLMPEEDMWRLQNENTALNEKIERLQSLASRYPDQKNKNSWELICNELSNKRKQVSKAVLKEVGLIGDLQSYRTLEELESALDAAKMAANSTHTLLTVCTNKFNKIESSVRLLETASNVNVEQLVIDNAKYHQQLLQLEQTLELNYEFASYQDALVTLRAVIPNMLDALANVPENSKRKLSVVHAEKNAEALAAGRNAVIKVKDILARANARVDMMKHQHKQGEVDCPKCNNRFVPTISPRKQEEINNFIAEKQIECMTLEAEVDVLEQWAAEYEEYRVAFINVVKIMRSVKVLDPLWDKVNQEELLFNNPPRVAQLLNTLQFELETRVKMEHVFSLIKQNDTAISQLQGVDASKLTEQREEMAALEAEVVARTMDLDLNNKKAQYLSTLVNGYNKLRELRNVITSNEAELDRAAKNVIECMRIDAVRAALEEAQVELAIKTAALSTATKQQAVVDGLKATIAIREVEEKALKILVKELSPTEGLIADGLIGSINAFIKHMNKLIQRVWTYPFKIKPCQYQNNQEVDLDYKFPIVVMGREPAIADVALGSAGMKEIVNLAFKVVAMQYLHMTNHPLKLDEFGAAFDESHRLNATMAIKQLMEVLPFSQLWMISHYEESFGAFTNAEICVLSKDNISIPITCNKHVTFR